MSAGGNAAMVIADATDVQARVEDLFMDAAAVGIFDRIADAMQEKEEAGEPVGGIWIWEMFKALCQQEELL